MVQVLDVERIRGQIERFVCVVSDGINYQHALLGNRKLNHLVHDGTLKVNCCVLLNSYICTIVQDEKIIIILDLVVEHPDVAQRIGNALCLKARLKAEAQVAAEAKAAAGAESVTVAGAAGAAPRPPPRPVTLLTLSIQRAAAPAAGGVAEAQVAVEAEAAVGAERATVAGAPGAAPRPPPRPVTQLTLSMQRAAAPAAGGVADDVARTNINHRAIPCKTQCETTMERTKRPLTAAAQARYRSRLIKAPRVDYTGRPGGGDRRRRRSPAAAATELQSVVRE
jgi:hypothetical protein